MENKANARDYKLKTYISLEQIGITTGSETFDGIANALPDGATLIYNVNISQNADIYPYPYGVCKVVRVIGARILFEFVDNNGSHHWNGVYYYSANPTFADWVPLATATPGKWIDLPLGNGITSTTSITYKKDGNGGVEINGVFSVSDSNISNRIIGTLPNGYRPDKIIRFALLQSQGWIDYGVVQTNGNISFKDGTP